jgi:uncharacterized protein
MPPIETDRAPVRGPAAAPLPPPANSLPRRVMALWIMHFTTRRLFVLAALVAWVLLPLGPAWLRHATPLWVRMAVLGAFVVATVLHAAIVPALRYRVHRWELRADCVHTLVGWPTRSWHLVPLARVQTVHLHRGLYERVLGLSTVVVHTASTWGHLHIAGLDRHDADDLVARLVAVAAANREVA